MQHLIENIAGAIVAVFSCGAIVAVATVADKPPGYPPHPRPKPAIETVELKDVPPQSSVSIEEIRVRKLEQRLTEQAVIVLELNKKLDQLLTPQEKADAERSR